MNTSDQTVFIIDDDEEICELISFLVQSIDIKAEIYANAEMFLNSYCCGPGCVLADIRMKGMSGLRLQEELISRHDFIPIIFITGHGDIQMAKQAIKAGAEDFFTKPFNNQALLEAVQRALEKDNERQLQKAKKSIVLKNFNRLSKRERQVMQCVVNGKLNKIIATELNISMSTVETHRARIMKKMDSNSLATLIAVTLRYNLLPIDV